MNNPLRKQLEAPPFEEVEVHHFEEIMEEVFMKAEMSIADLIDEEAAPTFENSVTPLDSIFFEIVNLSASLGSLLSHRSTKDISDLAHSFVKKSEALKKRIYQNLNIAARFKSVHTIKESLDLTNEDKQLLEFQNRIFLDAGAFLDETSQKKLFKIDEALTDATHRFNKNHKKASVQHSILITDKNELSGVSTDVLADLQKQAGKIGKKGWLFLPERKLSEYLLSTAEDREFRKKVYIALNSLCTTPPSDNRPIIREIHSLRHQRANLLQYQTYAALQLSHGMCGTSSQALLFLDEYSKKLTVKFEEDVRILQEWLHANGGPTLEAWDMLFYIEKYKEAKFQFDEKEFSNYLKLENVLTGWLRHIQHDFHLTITHITDGRYQTWYPDVLVYQITNNKSQNISLLYLDLFKRSGKRASGIWSNIVQQEDKETGKLNIAILTMNLVKPPKDRPVLLRSANVTGLYHEGGHIINFLTSHQASYRTSNAFDNDVDFREIHSHLEENYAFHPDILKTYAYHYETGEVLPSELLDAKIASDRFFASFRAMMILQSSLYDLHFHMLTPETYKGVEHLQSTASLEHPHNHLVHAIALPRFHFIFRHYKSQYAANFWNYIWSDAAQAIAFKAFAEQGIDNEILLQKKRRFYSGRGQEGPNAAFELFTGQRAGPLDAYLSAKFSIE